jgi:hypothetical protein
MLQILSRFGYSLKRPVNMFLCTFILARGNIVSDLYLSIVFLLNACQWLVICRSRNSLVLIFFVFI